MKVGGLFSGIGGWELGLERAGMQMVWHCEADEFCRSVLARHWPSVPVYDDVRELRGAEVEPVDVLCGGFPCQDLSLAGKGAGLDGERSGLWSEYARLIRELRPRYVLVENVPGLIVRGFGRVLGELAASGYDAEWDCIPASAVGAPHIRDRVWIVAYPAGDEFGQPASGRWSPRRSRPRVFGLDGEAWDVADPESLRLRSRGPRGSDPGSAGQQQLALQTVAVADHPGRSERRRPKPLRKTDYAPRCSGQAGADADGIEQRLGRGRKQSSQKEARGDIHQWTIEPGVDRVAHGVPNRVDRLRSLGNALVPQISEWIGRRLLEWEDLNNPTR